MDNEEYIRVGTCYLKLCRVPTATGEFREKYLPWNIETIRQDHSKDFVANIKKYDGYCFFPAHVDYQRMYGNFLNMYEPIPYHPEPGEFPHIRVFSARRSNWGMTTCNCFTADHASDYRFCCSFRGNAIRVRRLLSIC